MEAWVIIAIAAAAFQTLRFMVQKQLSMGTLSIGGATFSRFFYSVPFISTLAVGYALVMRLGPPVLGTSFWVYAFVGGLSQILATWCMVVLFQQRIFAVGITFKKTEVLLAALVGLIVLGDAVSLTGFVAILTGFVGVLVLSQTPGETDGTFLSRVFSPSTGLGLLSGMLFAISAVGYRGATLEVLSSDPLYRASITLMLVTIAQTLGMLAWLALREPGEISRVVAARKTAVWMGVTGMAGSLCWFTAFTLQNAAYVFAVGQIEVVFSLLATALFFREVITRNEYMGMAIITASILCLVVAA